MFDGASQWKDPYLLEIFAMTWITDDKLDTLSYEIKTENTACLILVKNLCSCETNWTCYWSPKISALIYPPYSIRLAKTKLSKQEQSSTLNNFLDKIIKNITLSDSSFSTSFLILLNINGFKIICKRESWSVKIYRMHVYEYFSNIKPIHSLS